MARDDRSTYPFSAIVGQDALRTALLINAVDPRVGGVLIRGQKGTAKSTAVRALRWVLPEIEVVEGCRFGCDPSNISDLCPECRERAAINPLRSFDCKVPSCRETLADAPRVADHLCPTCREHHARVQECLTVQGLSFISDHTLVRGMDYYTRTTFELTSTGLGAQDTVAAGGRYDRLVEEFGGAPTPGIGFALGVERLLLVLPADAADEPPPPVFLAALGDAARHAIWPWLAELRRRGVAVEWDYEGRSLKSQLRRADRLRARRVVIVGENELKAGMVQLRDMAEKTQREVAASDLIETLAPTVYAEGG